MYKNIVEEMNNYFDTKQFEDVNKFKQLQKS